jgi:hypothetical protein
MTTPTEVLEAGAGRSQVERDLIRLIGTDISHSIRNLGFPVGMGVGIGPELSERAAAWILDRLTEKALTELLAARQASRRGG